MDGMVLDEVLCSKKRTDWYRYSIQNEMDGKVLKTFEKTVIFQTFRCSTSSSWLERVRVTGAAGWKYRFRCLLPHKFFFESLSLESERG